MSASSKKKAAPSTRKKAAPSTRKKAKAKVTKTKKVAKEAPVEKEKPKKATPKAKKTEEKKEVPSKTPAKTVAKVEHVKLGPPPAAIVAVRQTYSGSPYERAARGFSFGELESAGIPANAARHGDLSLDIRRRSVVQANVEMLKGWFKSPAAAAPRERMEKPVAVVAAGKK